MKMETEERKLLRTEMEENGKLTARTEIKVRFSETDAMGIVWHGNYAKFFEDGREHFGKEYGLDYMRICSEGYSTPIVEMNCRYRKSLKFGDRIIVETVYIPCEAAKILFSYTIYRACDNEIIATGSTVQVFLDESSELVLCNPEFYEKWKEKWLRK